MVLEVLRQKRARHLLALHLIKILCLHLDQGVKEAPSMCQVVQEVHGSAPQLEARAINRRMEADRVGAVTRRKLSSLSLIEILLGGFDHSIKLFLRAF